MHQGPITAAQEWRANWPIVFSALVAYSLIAVPSITLGLYMEPMIAEFGWTRSEFSAGLTILAIISTPLAPLAGALADRFGARRVVLPGVALHALVFASFGLLTPSVWHWLGTWAIYAVVQLLIRSMIWTGAISAAFTASRGLALAIFMSGTALAQVGGPLVTRWLIDDHGWRSGFLAIGLVWGGAGLLLVALFFRDLRQREIKTSDDTSAHQRPTAGPGGLTLAQACRDWRMIAIDFAMFVQALVSTGFMIHLVPMLGGGGVPRTTATTIIALTGLVALASQLGVGYLIDRLKSSLLPTLCFVWPGLGYLALMELLGGSHLAIGAAVLFIGFGAGTTLNVIVYLATRYAGLRNFGAIFGLISSFMGLASGIGPLLAGMIFDATGSYSAYLMLAIAGAVLSGLALSRLGPYPDYDTLRSDEPGSPSAA